MTGPDLKPCPFCGVRPHVHDDASHSTAFFAGCYNDNCPVQPSAYGLSRAEAITAWNTRAQVDYAALPEVQALVELAEDLITAVWHLMDNSEESGPIENPEITVWKPDFDEVSAILDRIEGLPSGSIEHMTAGELFAANILAALRAIEEDE